MHHPNLEDFRELYRKYRTVRVHGRFLGDSLTPISAFLKLGQDAHACLLESVSGGEVVGRFSFVGFSPFASFRACGNQVDIEEEGILRTVRAEDPIGELEEYLSRFQPVAPDSLPRLAGGAIGYLGYDAVRYVESLPDVPPDDLGLPDLHFCFYGSMLIFDNVDKSLNIVCNVFQDGRSAEEAYREAEETIKQIAGKLSDTGAGGLRVLRKSPDRPRECTSNFRLEDFIGAVERCKEYIRAGDIFQVVLAQRFHSKTFADPFDIYRALRTINPSPYMFYLDFDELQLVGASPEVMTRVEDDIVTVRPIAGTRRRGRTPAEDQIMEKELLNDPKEIAEHVMLLDLGRNDVGRICDFKTVKVTQEMELEKYSHVMHMTSNVEGRLSDGRSAVDALKACFPAGTVSGAPKIRAMEIIDELEPTKRGPYAGAVGYIDFTGNVDTAIAIRTIVMKGQDAYVQAGAGIVADSVPELEFKETENKARALMKALDAAEADLTNP